MDTTIENKPDSPAKAKTSQCKEPECSPSDELDWRIPFSLDGKWLRFPQKTHDQLGLVGNDLYYHGDVKIGALVPKLGTRFPEIAVSASGLEYLHAAVPLRNDPLRAPSSHCAQILLPRVSNKKTGKSWVRFRGFCSTIGSCRRKQRATLAISVHRCHVDGGLCLCRFGSVAIASRPRTGAHPGMER